MCKIWFIGILLTPVLLSSSICLYGQVYVTEGKHRYTFAQTTVGYDLEFTPSTGYSFRKNANGANERFSIGGNINPIITITGLHFWGHAEFFTGFSLPNIPISGDKSYSFRRFAGTGAKIFPLAIKQYGFRPYLGMAIAAFSFQNESGPTYKRVEYPILLGLTYSFKHGLLELGANYYWSPNHQYFITKDERTQLVVPKLSFNIDYKYFFDFSIASKKRDNSGETEKTYEKLKVSKKLNSFFIATGPAYSFLIGESSYNKNIRPYLDDYKITGIFPDLGIGYYHYRFDAAINISYRSYTESLNAFDTRQSVGRKSLAIEVYKFFMDYHGFVPFAGAIASCERLRFHETENNQTIFNNQYSFWTPGIILGWDIRPTRVDWWGVRTNIRYFPLLKLNVDSGQKIDLRQIELNFLQFVFYPNRLTGHLSY
jgi:hypothetical protein